VGYRAEMAACFKHSGALQVRDCIEDVKDRYKKP
jgi:hypothetical protein